MNTQILLKNWTLKWLQLSDKIMGNYVFVLEIVFQFFLKIATCIISPKESIIF